MKHALFTAAMVVLITLTGCTSKPVPGPPSGSGNAGTAPPVVHPTPQPEPTPEPPKPQPVPTGERKPIPILMYHEISPGPNSLYVPPAELERHLVYLKDHGYQAVTLHQVSEHYKQGVPLPPKPIVLTFDDGYKSFYHNATPLLQKYGFPGTVFLITNAVGSSNFVTWDQVREAERRGMEIGAHTVSHPDLTTMKVDRLPLEVDASKAAIEKELGHPIFFFCYPAGKQNEPVVAAVRAAGFVGAVTTAPGAANVQQDALLWKRIRVNQGTAPDGLGYLIRNAVGG